MAFKNLREFIDRASITLPIGDKAYTFLDVDAETLLMIQELLQVTEAISRGEDVDDPVLNDLEEADLYRRVLGDTYDELITDRVYAEELKRVLATVMVWAAGSVEQAEAVWEGRDPGKSPARPQNRADKRAAARGTRTSARTGTVSSTRKPGPGSTTPPARTSKATAAPARASRGRSSTSTSA